MNTAKVYYNQAGEPRTIHQMVRDEPDWAANRIQAGEAAIARVTELEAELAEANALVARLQDRVRGAFTGKLYEKTKAERGALLAACKRALDWSEGDDEVWPILAAAIAMAEGR